jgi:hypothetical protein
MLAFRLYIALLCLFFVLVTLFTRGVGVLEATVAISVLLFLILDIKSDMNELRKLEMQIALIEGA